MSMFDNASDVTIFENSAYFQPGRYIVKIEECKLITGGHKGDSFVIQCNVLGVKSDSDKAPGVGETAAQVWNASGEKRDLGRSTWFGFLCAAYAVQLSDYDNAGWKALSEAVIERGALNGTVLYLECFNKITKAGRDFTKHNWGGVPTAEQMAEFEVAA